MRAGRGKMPMYGLVDVDITTANRLLAGHDPPWSLTAFVVASVARAAAACPEVHAYRNWRGQLVTHRHVDVGTMVEISTPHGPFAIPHLLRDADSVISGYLSMSWSAPHLYGDRLEDFVGDARALLEERSPDGLFWDWPGDTVIVIARRAADKRQ